ncbi:hypothetical protein [Geodermatophilus sp. SYSU D01036]
MAAARAELRWAEATLARLASQADEPAVASVRRALHDVRTLQQQLDRPAPATRAARPERARVPDIAAQLRQAEQLLALGQLKRAAAVVDVVAARLADQELPGHHPWPLQLARLRKQLAPAPRGSSRGRGETRSTSVRTVSGGLPTLGRRR